MHLSSPCSGVYVVFEQLQFLNVKCHAMFWPGVYSSCNFQFTRCSTSKVNLYRYPNSTYCFPIVSNEDLDAFVEVFSDVDDFFNMVESNESLAFGTWSYITRKNISAGSFDSSSVNANALAKFVRYAQWQRVAVITHASSHVYVHTVEQFYQIVSSLVTAEVFQVDEFEESVDQVFKRIQGIRYRIIIVALPRRNLNQVLCKRLALKMVWPEYAWLVVVGGYEEEIALSLQCKIGIIIFQPETVWMSSLSGNLSSSCYDKLTLTYVPDIIFCEHDFRPTTVVIYQWDTYPVHIANYTTDDGLGPVSLHHFPYDVPVEVSLIWFLVLALLHLLIFILVTAILALFVRYRHHSSIKASSVSLNMLVFISCYILLTYLVIINLMLLPGYRQTCKKLQDSFCLLRIWGHGFSVPTVTIVAVLLIKLVRIYKLFNSKVVLKKWKCHDGVLAVYVIMLSFPVIMICALDSITSGYKSALVVYNTRYYLDCCGTGQLYGIIVQPVYISVLCSLVVLMAIKTRKIRLGDFKDTKKLVILMLVIFSSFIGFFIYFFIVNIGGSVIIAVSIKQACNSILILGSMVCLFVPKFNFLLEK